MKRLVMLIAASFMTMLLAACGESPAEQKDETKADNAMEKVETKMNGAAETAKDKMDEAKEKMNGAAETAKEKMDEAKEKVNGEMKKPADDAGMQ